MKIQISYLIPVEKEIEISPEDYCLLRANTDSRPDVFPSNSRDRRIFMDALSHDELYDYFDKKEKERG